MIDALIGIRDVAGLHDTWARATMMAAPRDTRPPPTRTLFDTLGIGLEQALAHLGRERPAFGDFADWIVATAGPPNPSRIDRYHAWYHSAPLPAAETARQAAVMAADPVFDAADLATWERDGVVVLRNAITPDEAVAIADHLWATIAATPGDPATWYGPRTNGIMIQQFQHPAMDVPRHSARLHKAFAQLYGHADLIASTDRLSFNPPEAGNYAFPGPHLHWDMNLAPPMPFETASILYLTDTAADQGALQVVPGFHHRLAEGWLDSLDGADPRQVDLSAEAVTVPAGAGDLVIWRQEIPHGASANTSDRPRLAQYVTMYPMHWPDDRDWV